MTRARLLQRLGLERPEMRAWALYDWANSAFVTTVVAAVFPIYFSSVAAATLPPAAATVRFALATTIALAAVAIIAPVLGAVADCGGSKKRFLAVCVGMGTAATAAMTMIGHGDWLLAAGLFGVANIAISASFIFYDALLPHVAHSDEEMDRLSASAYACGYLGGGLLLALNLALIARPSVFGLADAAAAARVSFLSVALWWLLFSVPLFLRVAEPPRRFDPDEHEHGTAVVVAWQRLGRTFQALRRYRQASLFLVGFFIYNDGIGTIIRMAAIYGTEIGLPRETLVSAILLVQFVGVPFAVLFGAVAVRIGVKPVILLALAVYVGIAALAYFTRTAWQFYLLAVLVGTVQGGSQALSRSLFARLIPRFESAEFFAFFSVCEKLSGILGPALFAAITATTGSSRNAIPVIILFFVTGGLLISRVDVNEGRRVAREADARAVDWLP